MCARRIVRGLKNQRCLRVGVCGVKRIRDVCG